MYVHRYRESAFHRPLFPTDRCWKPVNLLKYSVRFCHHCVLHMSESKHRCHICNVYWVELVRVSVVLTIGDRGRESCVGGFLAAVLSQRSTDNSFVLSSQKSSRMECQAIIVYFTSYIVSSHIGNILWCSAGTSGAREPLCELCRMAGRGISHC